jgi:hypothetical protein
MPTKTPFSTKCEILGTLWTFYKDTEHENWKEFFAWADLGLPLSYHVWQGLATAKPEGKEVIEETWGVLCEMLNVDPNEKYENFSSFMDSSPQPEVEN